MDTHSAAPPPLPQHQSHALAVFICLSTPFFFISIFLTQPCGTRSSASSPPRVKSILCHFLFLSFLPSFSLSSKVSPVDMKTLDLSPAPLIPSLHPLFLHKQPNLTSLALLLYYYLDMFDGSCQGCKGSCPCFCLFILGEICELSKPGVKKMYTLYFKTTF